MFLLASVSYFLFTNNIFAGSIPGDFKLSIDGNLYNNFSFTFVSITIMVLITGGNLKRKNITLKKSAIFLKAVSVLPLMALIYIVAASEAGFFSAWEVLSAFASLLFSIFLFATADFLEEK